jgi:hypothetical protein
VKARVEVAFLNVPLTMPHEGLMNAPFQPASSVSCLKLYKFNRLTLADQGMLTMTKQQVQSQGVSPKRISPELAEVLHMLKSLETEPVGRAVPQLVR